MLRGSALAVSVSGAGCAGAWVVGAAAARPAGRGFAAGVVAALPADVAAAGVSFPAAGFGGGGAKTLW